MTSYHPQPQQDPTGNVPLAAPMLDGIEDANLELASDALIGARAVAKGEVICSPGAGRDVVWLVMEGSAGLTRYGIAIDTIGPGQLIGRVAVLESMGYGETCTARTDMTLLEFDHERFCELVMRSPHLSLSIARMQTRKLQVARNNSFPTIEIW